LIESGPEGSQELIPVIVTYDPWVGRVTPTGHLTFTRTGMAEYGGLPFGSRKTEPSSAMK